MVIDMSVAERKIYECAMLRQTIELAERSLEHVLSHPPPRADVRSHLLAIILKELREGRESAARFGETLGK